MKTSIEKVSIEMRKQLMKSNGAKAELRLRSMSVLRRRSMRSTMRHWPSKKDRGFQRSFQIKVLGRKSQKYGQEVYCRKKKISRKKMIKQELVRSWSSKCKARK